MHLNVPRPHQDVNELEGQEKHSHYGLFLCGRDGARPSRKPNPFCSHEWKDRGQTESAEDKVVQQACVTILSAVYEPIFSGVSYGSRPGRSQHDALDALHEGIARRKINWILDCDIEGFFDNLSHVYLLSFLEERVADKRMLRLIRKWLRVGWVEDGMRHAGTIGTPQGSVISPLLANIFLNTVMDKWALKWRRTEAKGDVIIVRYVDDAVFGFQYEAEGRAFLEALREQVEAYGLRLHPTKTRLVEFGRYAANKRQDRGQGKPETFDYLGFTHICGKTRKGRFCIKRITIRKRLCRKLGESSARVLYPDQPFVALGHSQAKP